jgi:uncharacterized membrane protein
VPAQRPGPTDVGFQALFRQEIRVPDIGRFHPEIVHFVVALLAVGVVARALSLAPLPERLRFLSPAATALIVLGAVASVIAVHSGIDAHGPAERVPGARDAVVEHEDWGKRTRNLFLGVAALELLALALRSPRAVRGLQAAAAVAGLAGLFVLYETAEHGGEVVYRYAGGVGIRSGDTTDVRRLLVAGLYHAARVEREAGRPEGAARLLDELGRQRPDDGDVRLLVIESRMLDRKDARGALAALDSFTPAPENRRLELRKGLLRVDVLEALGRPDSARAEAEGLLRTFPDNPRVVERLSRLR